MRTATTAILLLAFIIVPGTHAFAQVAEWTFTGGSANDVSGNGHHGTVFGASPTPDRFGVDQNAFFFNYVENTTTHSISVPGHSDFRFANGQAFSISIWVKVCGNATMNMNVPFQPSLLGTRSADEPNARGWEFQIRPTVGLVEWVWAGRTGMFNRIGSPDNTFRDRVAWTHYVVTVERDGPADIAGWFPMRHKLYRDTRLVSDVVDTGNEFDFTSDTSPLTIGRSPLPKTYFRGALDDIAIYHHALSTSEINALYGRGGWSVSYANFSNITIAPIADDHICEGDSVVLFATGTGPIARWEWTPTAGLKNSASNRTIARPSFTTTYRVTAWDAMPCEKIIGTREVTITVDPAPRMPMGDVKYLCKGERLKLGAPVNGGLPPYRFKWSPAAGLDDPAAQYPTFTADASHRYDVAITDARGCVWHESLQMTVLPPPIADAGPDTVSCGGAGVLIGSLLPVVGGNPPYTFRWYPKAGLGDSTQPQTLARPTVTTRYYLEVTDGFSCLGRDSVLVSAVMGAIADAGDDIGICSGDSAAIGKPAIAGQRYEWSPTIGLSNAFAANPVARPTTNTTYYLSAVTDAGCTAIDSVQVTVLDPKIAASDSLLDFGILDACTTSSELTVYINNVGSSELNIVAASFAGRDFVVTTPLAQLIAPGDSGSVTVRFAPRGSGDVRDTLTIVGQCDVAARIALHGSRETSFVYSSTASIDFGRRLICDLPDTVVELTISNSGATGALLHDALIATPFAITSTPSLPVSIAAGDSLELLVRYRPTAAGVHRDELRIPFQSGSCRDTIRVRLSGVVEQPKIDGPNSVMMGTLGGCELLRDTTAEVSNPGTETIKILSAVTPGGFRLLTPLPIDIEGGGIARLAVRFEPASNGVSNGDLVLAAGPCDLVQTIALSGTKEGSSITLDDSIDFATIVDCSESTTTRESSISFAGASGESATLTSVNVSGPFTTTLRPGTVVRAGESAPFDIIFTPTADGLALGGIDLVFEPCTNTRRIELTGARTSVLLDATDVDFGNQLIGVSVTRDVAIVNRGTATVRIDSLGALLPPFSLLGSTPQLPAMVAPGDTLIARIRYTPSAGSSNDTMQTFAGEPCTITTNIPMHGVGEGGATADIAIPNIVAAAGDRVNVALVLRRADALDVANARTFEAVIAFDRSMLVPTVKNGVTVDATTRRVIVTGSRGVSDTLVAREMVATLGTSETTPLRIESFRWLDATSPVTTTLYDGELRIVGICRSGGTRLFDGSGEVLLKPPAPNPANGVTAIEYQLNEVGRTQLVLLDASGRRIATLVDDVMSEGVYMHWLDAAEISSGTYLLVLATPTIVLSERFEVRK